MNTTFQFPALLIITITFSGCLTSVSLAQEAAAPKNTQANPTAVFMATARKKSSVPTRLATYRLYQQEIAAEPNHTWQETSDGWHQVPMRSQKNVHVMSLPHQPPRVHPFSIASLILLLTLAAMTWASSEWDWCRLIGAEYDN